MDSVYQVDQPPVLTGYHVLIFAIIISYAIMKYILALFFPEYGFLTTFDGLFVGIAAIALFGLRIYGRTGAIPWFYERDYASMVSVKNVLVGFGLVLVFDFILVMIILYQDSKTNRESWNIFLFIIIALGTLVGWIAIFAIILAVFWSIWKYVQQLR
ncbi:hypothetical protein BD410DRAFT_830087 [Rickenella mellea]|uniref:Uncharacterized protein n=1 Tax=Rickenella mellea TaxID=50990 RepID=A0A4Y7PZ60_9AGAM|nr:hypothetical protein BD410DRAFT_830087 [Rickenella mellea]